MKPHRVQTNDIKAELIDYIQKLVDQKCKTLNSSKIFLNRPIANIDSLGIHPTRRNKMCVSSWYEFTEKDLRRVRNAIEKDKFYGKIETGNAIFKTRIKNK
jgi:hypothetical protein